MPVAGHDGALGEVDRGDLDRAGRRRAERRASIWPHVEERIVDLIAAHRSTLVFANSRRLAERLTARLNEIWEERLDRADGAADAPAPSLAATGSAAGRSSMAQAGASPGRRAGPRPGPPRLGEQGAAGADRGRPQGRPAARRGRDQLSLELGIDMGAVDLVIQVESPPSGRQRPAAGRPRRPPGRRGLPRACSSPSTAATSCRPRSSSSGCAPARSRRCACRPTRSTCSPSRSSRCAPSTSGTSTTLEALVRRAAPFAALPRSVLESVLDMLAGPLPERRVRRAAAAHRLGPGRRHAHRPAAAPSGSPSPAAAPSPTAACTACSSPSGEGPGRRVGELDEEMVYESRVGDVFTLGTSSWRIEDITHDRVLVTPAPGQPGRLPFWKGDPLGRPAELGRAVGAFVRELVGARRPAEARGAGARPPASTSGPPTTCSPTSREQREATGHVPDDRTIVVERFRDELGDWRVAVHSPFGAPGARAVGAVRRRPGCASGSASTCRRCTATTASCFRLPDLEFDDGAAPARGRAASTGRPRARRRARPGHRARSAARRCSPPGSASARRGPCCCRGDAPTGASRCGSSGSGRPSCSRSPASTPRSRSSSRRCASASRTSSTCRASSS